MSRRRAWAALAWGAWLACCGAPGIAQRAPEASPEPAPSTIERFDLELGEIDRGGRVAFVGFGIEADGVEPGPHASFLVVGEATLDLAVDECGRAGEHRYALTELEGEGDLISGRARAHLLRVRAPGSQARLITPNAEPTPVQLGVSYRSDAGGLARVRTVGRRTDEDGAEVVVVRVESRPGAEEEDPCAECEREPADAEPPEERPLFLSVDRPAEGVFLGPGDWLVFRLAPLPGPLGCPVVTVSLDRPREHVIDARPGEAVHLRTDERLRVGGATLRLEGVMTGMTFEGSIVVYDFALTAGEGTVSRSCSAEIFPERCAIAGYVIELVSGDDDAVDARLWPEADAPPPPD